MPPTLILIRHGEALHNLPDQAYHLRDPELTATGIEQCQALCDYFRKNLPLADDVELIVTSPFKRTLQTTSIGLSWLIERGVPVIARAEWQENSAKPCDTGSPLETVTKQYPDVDFSTIDSIYPEKRGPHAYTQEAVLQRGITAKAWLKARPEKVIAVVTHSAFLRTAVANARFANADYRIYDFTADGKDAEIVQWKLTESRGGGMGRSLKGRMAIEEGDFKDSDVELADRPVS